MANALRAAFERGANKSVLIGTDLADIEASDIDRAFKNTGKKVVVLGPAADGGFYLIGTDRPIGAPFTSARGEPAKSFPELHESFRPTDFASA